MGSRQDFEIFLGAHGLDADWQEARNCYQPFSAHLAWKAWQAAEAQTARWCELMVRGFPASRQGLAELIKAEYPEAFKTPNADITGR